MNHGVGFTGCGKDEGGVDGSVKFAESRVAATSFDLSGGGIDGNNVVSALEELAHQGAGEIRRVTGHANDGDASLGEESRDRGKRVGYSHHEVSVGRGECGSL